MSHYRFEYSRESSQESTEMKRGSSVKRSVFPQTPFLLCLLLSLLGLAKATSTLDSALHTVSVSLMTALEKTSLMEVTLENEMLFLVRQIMNGVT
jgi:hypothetical protein